MLKYVFIINIKKMYIYYSLKGKYNANNFSKTESFELKFMHIMVKCPIIVSLSKIRNFEK